MEGKPPRELSHVISSFNMIRSSKSSYFDLNLETYI